ncbi:hypothetical protein GCM10012320_32460 [Sinomonas cellulolyticus]|uniref:Uncharacterized protein n=1 Tax=Sinomonas cellulolyticus TaxID=2801916 RepID=A0ABS1JYE9_9MICC|nr:MULTISPECIES: hypothetical protein [Sinomonas]MBL0704274.1 hypothetical protein [Sinomonas cellulolyticus]GHG58681.1 hypothetical protein GCM10012320_32460 [Sinomonas sp. KCTC 49339]
MATAATPSPSPNTAGSPAAEQIGLGFAEVLALLAFHGGESAPATAELLGVDRYAAVPEMVSAGVSSLVARSFAHVDAHGELSVEGAVAGIAVALGGAQRRMLLTLQSDAWTDRIVLLEAPEVAVLARPRAYGTWWVLPQPADIPPAEATFHLVRGHLAEHPEGQVLVERHIEGQGVALRIRAAHDGGWLLGQVVPGTDEVADVPADDHALVVTLRAVRGDQMP